MDKRSAHAARSACHGSPAPCVTHPKLGEGLVLSEEGAGEAHKLEIDFGVNGKKKLLARFVTRVG